MFEPEPRGESGAEYLITKGWKMVMYNWLFILGLASEIMVIIESFGTNETPRGRVVAPFLFLLAAAVAKYLGW